MSHEISIRANGFAEMAFVGRRAAVWHGLGQELVQDASIEDWKVAAGMDWKVNQSPLSFLNSSTGEIDTVEDRKILYRNDNAFQLGIVSEDYKIVQPGQVLEFFDDLTRLHGMRLSTAGTLFGGKRFWALAEVGKKAEIVNGDLVEAYLLLTSSADGTMSTQARFTSTRVVCNNTLNIALGTNNKNAIKITHKKDFDPKEVKIDLGLLDAGWERFRGNLEKLSKVAMDEVATEKFYKRLFFEQGKSDEDQSIQSKRIVESLMNRAFAGIGSEMSKGTAWGALNGATELFTHWKGNRDQSIQFMDSYMGGMADRKNTVFESLVEMV